MQLPYFYHPESTNTESITLSEETSRHIVQVLRMQEGDKIQITNGRGELITATIALPHKKHTQVRILEKTCTPVVGNQHIIAISIIKNTNRLEWFMEKATELGISQFIPLICNRTEKSVFRQDRMNSILISAMLQSRQTYLPLLSAPVKFDHYLETVKVNAGYIAHCYEGEKQEFKEVAGNSEIILIGPEGDFTPEEVEKAQAKGFMPVSLGRTRLRTETAAVAAAVLMCI